MNLLEETKSICPECHEVLPARVYEEGGVVYIDKECPEHGYFKDVYWGDYAMYLRARRFAVEGRGVENPRTEAARGCPFDCGICPNHRSHTALAIIDVTNRCVTGDTEVILEDGTVRIKDLVEGRVRGKILSWDRRGYTSSFEEIVGWQRLRAPETLVRIKTRTGRGVFTPDHEVLVDTAEGPTLKRADAIKVGDRVYSIAKIPLRSRVPTLVEILAGAQTDFFVYSDYKDALKSFLKRRYGSLRRASKKLGIKYGRMIDSRISLSAKDLMKLGDWVWENLRVSKVKYHRGGTSVSFSKVNDDLAYLLGLVDSDGAAVSRGYPRGSVNYVAFDNECGELREEFRRVYAALFPDLKIREEEGRLISNSILVCTIARALSLKREGSFQRLLALNEPLIASFIAGYLDGDGHVTLRGSEIAFTFVRRRTAERMQYLLKRLGIASSVVRIRFGKGAYSRREHFYKCRIVGERSKLRFAELIKPRHPRKAERLVRLRDILLRSRHSTSYPDSAPRHTLHALERRLLSEGYPTARLGGSSTLYKVAAGRRGCSKQYARHQLQILIGGDGSLPELSDEYYLDEVIEVEVLRDHGERYVYDVTVSDTHLFVMNGGLIVSNCNLTCPVCFAFAGAAGYVYEPTMEQMAGMIDNLLANRPVKTPGLQLSGGEPTVRRDLPEIIAMAKEKGVRHVEVNTNGLRLAESAEYCRELKEAGADTVYLQFDGVTERPYRVLRGRDLLKVKLRAIENLREAGWGSVVLVPTVVRGVNDGELGGIIRFSLANSDVIRCVNMQPVSITGRIAYARRREMRITIPDCIRAVEEQTDGLVRAGDWYPVPYAAMVARALGAMYDRHYVEFSCHPHCGMGTYLVPGKEGGWKPITEYVDPDRFWEIFKDAYEQARAGHKTRAKLSLVARGVRRIGFEFLRRYLMPVFLKANYSSLADLHHRMIFLGLMHFMDPYNFDLRRAERCVIHYAVPDGRIISFCTMNSIHRPDVERKFAIPIERWREEHGGAPLDAVA